MVKYLLLATLLLAFFFANAQRNSKAEAEIRDLEQQIVSAILNADTNTLKKLWAPEFLVNNPRGRITASLDSVLLLQKNNFISYSVFERNIEAIQFHKKFVVTMGNEIFISKYDTPGVKAGQSYKRRFTNIWIKKKGRWQQIARHASIICS